VSIARAKVAPASQQRFIVWMESRSAISLSLEKGRWKLALWAAKQWELAMWY
jgi:hypothetical protein